MKKYLKWGGLALGLIIVVNVLTKLFEKEKEPIPEKLEINQKTSEVYGETAGVFSLVPEKYTLMHRDGKVLLKVKLRLNKTLQDVAEINSIKLVLKDDIGANVNGGAYESALELNSSEINKMLLFLKSKVDTEVSLIFSDSYMSYANMLGCMKSSKSFTIEDFKYKTKTQIKEEKEKIEAEKRLKAIEKIKETEEKVDKAVDDAVDQTQKAIKVSKDLIDLGSEIIEMTK